MVMVDDGGLWWVVVDVVQRVKYVWDLYGLFMRLHKGYTTIILPTSTTSIPPTRVTLPHPPPSQDMPVYERGEFGTFLRKHGMVDPEAGRAATSVRAISLGSWPCAVNCAVASPDGEWIAVVGDDLRVWLLLRKMGYHYSRAVVLTMTNPPNARRHQHGVWRVDGGGY